MKKPINLFVILSALIFLGCNRPEPVNVEQWDIFQIVLTSTETGNPFTEVELIANFLLNNKKTEVPGFYDGNGKYIIRFSPDKQEIKNLKLK